MKMKTLSLSSPLRDGKGGEERSRNLWRHHHRAAPPFSLSRWTENEIKVWLWLVVVVAVEGGEVWKLSFSLFSLVLSLFGFGFGGLGLPLRPPSSLLFQEEKK